MIGIKLTFTRVLSSVILPLIAIRLYYCPWNAGLVISLGGWFFHTRLYESAISFYTLFRDSPVAVNRDPALRHIALLHSYMGDCDKAIDLYENELIPLRKTTHGDLYWAAEEVFDFLQIYDDCAGQTTKAFDLVTDANERLMNLTKICQGFVEEGRATGEHYGLLFWGAFMEIGTGRLMREWTPNAVTNLALIPIHQNYTDKVIQYLSNLEFSFQPFPHFQHHFHKDTMWATMAIVDSFGLFVLGRGRFRLLLWLAGSSYWSWSIVKNRYAQSYGSQVLDGYDKLPPEKRLQRLERMRLMILDAPTRRNTIVNGLAVATVEEAIQAWVLQGHVDQVDYALPLWIDLVDALLKARNVMGGFDALFPPSKYTNQAYVHATFTTAPAKVRWNARLVTEEDEFRQLVEERQHLWENCNPFLGLNETATAPLLNQTSIATVPTLTGEL